MSSMDRRKFLGVVGAGSAVATAAAVSAAGLSAAAAAPAAPADPAAARAPGVLAFRAETGLPGRPWPAYATVIAEGSVDLQAGTGFVATRVLAGQTGNQAGIGLPGTAQLIRITGVASTGSTVRLQGVVEDRSTLARGESARKDFLLDRARRQLRAVIAGTEMSLPLVH